MVEITKDGKLYSLKFVEGFFSHGLLDIIEKNRHRIKKGAPRTVSERIDGLKKWADLLNAQNDAVAIHFKTFKVGDKPSMVRWIEHKIVLIGYLEKTFLSHGVRTKHTVAINWWLRFFADFAVAPSDLYLSIPQKNAAKQKSIRPKSKKKSVVDASCNNKIPERFEEFISDYIESIASDDPDREEKIRLFTNSIKEISVAKSDITINSFSELVEEAIARRLVRIRNVAEQTFSEELTKRSYWFEKALEGEKHYSIIIKWLAWKKGNKSGNTNPFNKKLQQLSNDDVVNAVLYCVIYKESPYYGIGFRWSSISTAKYNRIRRFFNDRGISLNAEDLIERVGASKNLLISAQIILVDELDANPDYVRQIKRDAVVKITDSVFQTSWIKARANYKRLGLVETLISNGHEWRTAHATINAVKEATEPYVKSAIPQHKDNIFLYNIQNSSQWNMRENKGIKGGESKVASTPSGNWFNENSQKLLSSVADELTVNSIRQSRILLEGLQSGLKSAQAKGRHVTTVVTNKHYLDKVAYTKKLESEIREFIEWLEALIVIDIEDYALKAGYDEKKFKLLQQKVIDDGFGGIVCNDPNAGFQEGTVVGDGCGLFLKCLTCENRSSVFFINKQNVTQMMLWARALADHIKTLESQEASKFYTWCQFIDTIYRELHYDSAHEAILLEAENEADAFIIKHGNPYMSALEEM